MRNRGDELSQNDELLGFLPSELDENTKKLIGRMLVMHRDEWKKEATDRCASIFPQLEDFNWAVNLKVTPHPKTATVMLAD